jgi:hypothetical protein
MGETVMPPRMDLLARLEDRARFVARRLGHDLGPLEPGEAGEHQAVCRRCSALLVLTPTRGIGVGGTACRMDCRSRRHLRLIPGGAERAGRRGR